MQPQPIVLALLAASTSVMAAPADAQLDERSQVANPCKAGKRMVGSRCYTNYCNSQIKVTGSKLYTSAGNSLKNCEQQAGDDNNIEFVTFNANQSKCTFFSDGVVTAVYPGKPNNAAGEFSGIGGCF